MRPKMRPRMDNEPKYSGSKYNECNEYNEPK